VAEPSVLYTVREGVATITLNRPRVLNALDRALSAELADAAAAAARDTEVWVVVVRGAGRAFCSGMDRTILSGGGIDEPFYRNWGRALNCLGERTRPMPQTRREDNRRSTAFRSQSGNQPRHDGRRRGDDREIRCIHEIIYRFDRGDAFDCLVERIDQANHTAKSSAAEVSENRASYGIFPGAAANESDRTRIENTFEMIRAHSVRPRRVKSPRETDVNLHSWRLSTCTACRPT